MAMDVAEIAAWEWDVAGGRMTWSTEPETLFGFPQGSFGEDRRLFNTVHPDDRERVQEAVEAAMSAGSTYECEYRARPSRWRRSCGSPNAGACCTRMTAESRRSSA